MKRFNFVQAVVRVCPKMRFILRLQGFFVKKLLEDGTFICSGAYKTQ